MLRPLYPPGHKRAGQAKDDKDLTPEEKAIQEQQLWLRQERTKPFERESALRDVADRELAGR